MKDLCSPIIGLKTRWFPVKLQESTSKSQFKIHRLSVELTATIRKLEAPVRFLTLH